MGDSEPLKTATATEKLNENRSSSSVSPESSISISRGSTPCSANTGNEKKLLEWWKRVAMDTAATSVLRTDNWMQAFNDMEMDEVKDELLEEFQQILLDHLKTMEREVAEQHLTRLREKLEMFEDNKVYEIRKVVAMSDKNMRYEWLSGQFMEDTKKKFQGTLKQEEHSIFAEEWKNEAERYEKGLALDMDNRLRREMGQTLEQTKRMFRNTAQELKVNKQANIDMTENNVQSYATNLTSNSEDRKYYLFNTITEYLSQERQRRDELMRQQMEKEVRTVRREVEQLRKTLGYGPARRCCASLCAIM